MNGADRGQADAGVAGGGLNDDRAGLQKALCLRVVQHGPGDSILDAARGIEIFELGENGRFEAVFRGKAVQLEQWGMADQVGNGISVFHREPPLSLHTYTWMFDIITRKSLFVKCFLPIRP